MRATQENTMMPVVSHDGKKMVCLTINHVTKIVGTKVITYDKFDKGSRDEIRNEDAETVLYVGPTVKSAVDFLKKLCVEGKGIENDTL